MLQNIALNQPASMSSQQWIGPARYAVDGITLTNYFAVGCASTTAENGGSQNPWWAVDFGERKSVVGVNIVNIGYFCSK